MTNLICPWESAKYLIFSANVPSILYYALIPGMIISLVFSIYIFIKDKNNINSKILLFMTSSFFIWGIFDLILFATNSPDQVMFFWSLVILIEPLIYISSFYLAITFINKKDISFLYKILLGILIIPIIIVLSTKYNLLGVNLNDCTAIESQFVIYYTYGLEILLSLSIVIFAIKKIRESKNTSQKKEIKYFIVGLVLFLITFSSGNIIGSFTDNWVASQYGYFGMPVFIGFLGYLIVKYKTFKIKLLATQALVWGLAILIGSQFFFIQSKTNFVLNGITFIGIIIFGQFLIKSVKREIEQRELLESLTSKLEQSNSSLGEANEKLKGLDKLKTEFVSLASHQLRSPLTAIRGYTSMLLEGDYGEMDPKVKDTIKMVEESSNNLTLVVEDLLNVSKIESGGMKYVMEKFDFSELVRKTTKELSITAEKKGLKLICNIPTDKKYFVNGDKEKLRQVIVNLIDNSMKYTKEGQIEVDANSNNGKVILTVKDTGVGIEKGKEESLFDKFSRGEGGKLNASGSGLGLYLVREIAKAHGGRVWAESEGAGKGSTFFVELTEVK